MDEFETFLHSKYPNISNLFDRYNIQDDIDEDDNFSKGFSFIMPNEVIMDTMERSKDRAKSKLLKSMIVSGYFPNSTSWRNINNTIDMWLLKLINNKKLKAYVIYPFLVIQDHKFKSSLRSKNKIIIRSIFQKILRAETAAATAAWLGLVVDEVIVAVLRVELVVKLGVDVTLGALYDKNIENNIRKKILI